MAALQSKSCPSVTQAKIQIAQPDDGLRYRLDLGKDLFITTSAVSVDPTEALNKKYKELEEEYEKKRLAVEEEIARNDEKNQSKVEELKGELLQAKDSWLQEKSALEEKVESFRKMVAEMEAEALEQAHKLDQMLKVRDQDHVIKPENSSLIGSQDSEEENETAVGEVHVNLPGRPTTAVRNTLTPGPDNPVITQVVTMYDHVTEFKEKLVDILGEIQNMGVIDETETMLMMRSLEQINTIEFVKEGDIHDQIEGIQNSIAQVMHSSEKTVHKIFKKLSKERGKIEKLTWSPVARSPAKSRQRSVVQCDRATSPIHHFRPQKAPKSDPVPRGTARRGPANYTAMFAFTDLEHNRRSLKQAVLNHKITPKQYEEVVAMMKDYTNIPQKRLQHLAKHYISHARMQIMEENIQMNRPVNEDIDDVLSRLDELYLLRKTRYGAEMDELAAEREDLAYLLTKQLDRLEHQSGIFLIKPYIAYKAHTLNKNQQRKTPVFVQQNRPSDPSMVDLEQSQEPESGPTWSVGASRTTPAHDWSPDIPKLLEMDCNRITVARNTVSQPADTKSSSKTIKSFVVVRPSKSTGSFRPKSNATSTAEFLSINSDYKSEDISLTTSDNLPPLRSGYTSGFVSTSNSRQRLAPIVSPPGNINIEKATSVT